MNTPRIRDVSYCPPSGWWAIDDVSKAKLEANSFRNLKHTIMSHRNANNIPWIGSEIEDMIHRQVCEREGGDYCKELVKTKTHHSQGSNSISIKAMLSNFITESVKLAKSGFKLTSEEEFHRRLEICRKCSFWDEAARNGLGKCRKCGCTKLKHWYSTSHCPIKLWSWLVLFSLGNFFLV